MADTIFKVTEKGQVTIVLRDEAGKTMSLAEAKTKLKAVVDWRTGDYNDVTIVDAPDGLSCFVSSTVVGDIYFTVSVDIFHPITNVKTTLNGQTILKVVEVQTVNGLQILVEPSPQ